MVQIREACFKSGRGLYRTDIQHMSCTCAWTTSHPGQMGRDPAMVAITISLLCQLSAERLQHVLSFETEVMSAHIFGHFWEIKCSRAL